MNTTTDNWMIKASAGSGKTYTLVSRYIQLLHRHADPGRIMALTFTRKAAGEFMEKIMERLIEAASDPAKAAETSERCGLPPMDTGQYEALLRLFIREIGNVHLGTIDSFFSTLVRAFPYELGLAAPPRLMERHEESFAQQVAMSRLFSAGSEEDALELLEIFKHFTFGLEEKSVFEFFRKQINSCHLLYWEDRDIFRWGDLATIFGSRPEWAEAPDDITQSVEALMDGVLESPGWGKLRGPLNEMTSALLQWRPGETFKGKTLFWRLVEAYSQLGEGEASIQYNRGAYYFSGDIARHLHEVLGYYLRREYEVRSVRTRHLGILLQGFEANYSQLLRETGGVVFADLPRLLVDHLRGEACQIGASLLQYRLDTRIDHWLLDEFQDTSRLQWNVLSGFIDEAVQAGSAERSLFYVGDVKQSIYGWRGGDSRLFDYIRGRYAEVIQTRPLNKSFRSCRSVIQYVNRIFGNLKTVEALPKAVRDRWQSNWEEHSVADHLLDQSGFAGLFEVVEASTVEDGCIELLRKVNPLARGLSCAILLRKNRQVGEMTAALRAAGIPASMEGETTIVSDNAAGLWLLSLLGRLARPQEGLPRQMPATMALPGLMGALSDTLDAVRMALSRGRYAEATGVAMKAVAEAGLAGDFIQLRIFQLIEAARQFEEGENPSLEGFIQYLLQFKVRESSNSGAVQVMTVHKSKGLDFDIVLLAGFGSENLIRPDYSGLKEKRNAKREVEWIFTFPKKELALVDPALRPVLQQREADDLFEATCLLYVAMTRAKRGLYAICKPDNKSHSAAVWLDLFAAGSQTAEELGENLPVLESLEFKQAEGNFGWFEEPTRSPKEPTGEPPACLAMAPLGVHFAPRRPLQRRPSPSGVAHALQGRGPSIPSAAGRRFGSDMHLFLSRFQWIDFSDTAALQVILDRAAAPLRPRLAAFFETPLAREVFASPPAGVVEVWRERPYALKHDGYLTNGIMDRVHLWREGGRATKAIIYDFKTDALDPTRSAEEQLLERYAPQLDLYREALSQLEGMPIAAVSGRLVPV